MARATSLREMVGFPGRLSEPCSPRGYEQLGEKSSNAEEAAKYRKDRKKSRTRRKSSFEWGSNSDLTNTDIQGVQDRLRSLQEYVRKKERRPHYSQIHGGKIEVMTADDDPINQVLFVLASRCS